jgi:DNA helicase HerA-like ATPase
LPSWRGLLGKLWRIHRLKLFDNPDAKPLNHAGLLEKGRVSIIDLSDTDSPQVNNLVIADVLRGVWQGQEAHFEHAAKAGEKPTPVVVIIEEAHEFLSDQRIKQMPVLFQQVARIAKRGRKRWLGLVFVTQLPQHLPNEVLGLINNYIVHKIGDSSVVDRLKRSISGIDKGLWSMVTGLAPGQALVSLTSMTRPLLVSIDPTPCRLQLVE